MDIPIDFQSLGSDHRRSQALSPTPNPSSWPGHLMALDSMLKHEAEAQGASVQVEVGGVEHVGQMEALILGSPHQSPALSQNK